MTLQMTKINWWRFMNVQGGYMRLGWAVVLMGFAALPVLAADNPIWSYGGLGNDEDNWPGLAKNYITCEIGTQQSPVVIAYTDRKHMPPLDIHYAKTPVHIVKKDYTLVIETGHDNMLNDGGHRYRLQEIRMHTPAEHHVLGMTLPLELQFIHKNDKGKILILSQLVDLGQANAAFQPILDHAPENDAQTGKAMLDLPTLLPKDRGYFAYTGSLTTPPCSEGVEWRILKYVIEISKDQQRQLAHFIGRNSRLPQPVYMRTIKETDD
jgi:carbonic anhydrase